VVKRGGMVVFCAGTTGYNLTFDARYVWMRQKRIQGSHFAHLKQASAANQFVLDRRVDPCMSKVFPWDKIPDAHQMMWKNQHPARQHGGAGERAAPRLPHARRRAGAGRRVSQARRKRAAHFSSGMNRKLLMYSRLGQLCAVRSA
jgi:hypothetical protein